MSLLGIRQETLNSPMADVSSELAAMQKVALVEYFKILLSLTRLEKT
jgi:hypothetical protein